MRILHLIFSMQVGGTESMLVDIANCQSVNEKVDIIIVNDEIHEPLLTKLDKAINVIKLKRKPGSKSIFPILQLQTIILKNRYNIIHCHNHNMAGMLLPVFKKRSILTVHTTGVKSVFFSKYKNIYAISQAVANDLKQRADVSSIVVNNGIDFSQIETKKLQCRTERHENFHIVQVSRLNTNNKGQHVLIEAARILKERGVDNIEIDFIGEGKSLDKLQDLVNDYQLDKNIRFLGLRDRSYIYSHLKNYDLLVQPSFYEGFGLTVVEGMAAKIPVLVSNIEGPMEVIEFGKYGDFFEVGNVNCLADKIQEIIQRSENQKAVEMAYEYALKNYSVQSTAKRYLEEVK
ncbi:MAG: glycosyltransferase [Sphingobacteriales bacterium]|jgi:glycosyltransferase involved in cell wall biosynthesis|nr:glycosyltransferase [Sphingobacteriales bacterium]